MASWVGALAAVALRPHLPEAHQPYAHFAFFALVFIGMASGALGGVWQAGTPFSSQDQSQINRRQQTVGGIVVAVVLLAVLALIVMVLLPRLNLSQEWQVSAGIGAIVVVACVGFLASRWMRHPHRRTIIKDSFGVTDTGAPEGNRGTINRSFDPSFCGKVCRIAAVISVAITLCTAILLATLQSSQCPGWMIRNGNGTSSPIWPFLLMTGFWALVVSYYAVAWKRFARRVLDEIQRGEATLARGTQPTWYAGWTQFNAMSATQLDFNSLFVVVMIASVLLTAAPLILMGIKCF